MRRALVAVVVAALAAAGGLGASLAPSGSDAARPKLAIGIHKIKHVIVIMQENRSFDQLLRHVSRAPTASRCATACRRSACPTRPTAAACSRSTTRATSTAAARTRRATRDRRHQRRQDGRLRRAAPRTRSDGCLHDPNNPSCAAAPRPARRDGLPRRPATSRTTGRTRETSCCRTTCSSRTRRGACPRTCSWSRSGRRTARRATTRAAARTTRQTAGSPTRRERATRPTRRSTRGPTSPTSCTSNGVSWALLRRQRAPSPTARTTTMICAAASRRTPTTPGIWNPLPYFDTVHRRRPARQHPVGRALLRRGEERARCRRCRGSCPTGSRQRAPARDGQRGPGLRHEPRQRGRCAAPTGSRPRSSSPGTTGAASTTTSCRRRRRATATACACPAS